MPLNATVNPISIELTITCEQRLPVDDKIFLSERSTTGSLDDGQLPCPSLAHHLVESCAKYKDKIAFINFGTEISFTDLEKKSRDFAAWLQSEGSSKGSRVALMLPNLIQFPIALFGALRAGCTIVNCSPLYSARELESQLIDSEADTIIILENFAANLEACISRTHIKKVITTQVGDQLSFSKKYVFNLTVKYIKKSVPSWKIDGTIKFNHALKIGSKLKFTAPSISPDDVAFLQYTGGTTGISKAAMLTHANSLSNMLQMNEFFDKEINDDNQLIVTALPLYHIFALTVNCFWPINKGITNLLITNARDIKALISEISKYSFTLFSGVNTLFNALLNHPDFLKINFSHLKITVGGGMAVQKSIAEKWKKVTGCNLSQGYGLTETSPVASINPLNLKEFNGSIGLPLPSTTISIRDEYNNILPLGEIGEICIQGPQVMKGYWNRPEETKTVFHEDGALRTGDLGHMNSAGYTTIVDRKKDMILVSGYNVYPNEVEDVVAQHPWVHEVAAIGVPHKFAGEVVKIYVVRKDDRLDKKEIMAHCRKYLASHKIPRRVEFRNDLPKTNIGKILRRALKEN